MFFIPLTQVESVELVIHSLKAAGGEADCQSCPASKVCMKQCLTIASAVEQMFGEGSLPGFDEAGELLDAELAETESAPQDAAPEEPPQKERPRLTLVKS
ncbi:MAG: hypothetical protein C0618_05740 [Desulfuromonas sp.]|nr:MAG: hypothetical protein C0618_05740 [Desulfuromonas sp.]